MTDFELIKKIDSLPKELEQEVIDFVEFLYQKNNSKKKTKQRKFGYAKGFFEMSPDFNAPLEDFKST